MQVDCCLTAGNALEGKQPVNDSQTSFQLTSMQKESGSAKQHRKEEQANSAAEITSALALDQHIHS